MAVSRGKDFEFIIKDGFQKVEGVSIDRLHDQTTGFKGSTNICDFIVYKEPYEYYIECKSVHGNRLPLSNITDKQWSGMLEKSEIEGVHAGVICWWVDKDVTIFIPIQLLQWAKDSKFVSVPYNFMDVWKWQNSCHTPIVLKGKKKRVFFEYDMEEFFNEVQHNR